MSNPVTRAHILLRVLAALAFVSGMTAPFLPIGSAQAASVTAMSFSGDPAHTATVNNTLYAVSASVMTVRVMAAPALA